MAVLVALAALPAEADDKPMVKGRVYGDEQPLAEAQVYAYEVASYALKKVRTDDAGHFLFQSLPAGLYKIIAFKDGFLPTVELLLRRNREAHQFVELRLEGEAEGEASEVADGYWKTRGQVPADVLRDLQRGPLLDNAGPVPGVVVAAEGFGGRVTAGGGVEQLGGDLGAGQTTAAEVDLQGSVSGYEIGVAGGYRQLVAEDGHDIAASTLSMRLDGPDETRIDIVGSSAETASLFDGTATPVDREHYRVSWTGAAGADGRTGVTARFTEESNYHRAGLLRSTSVAPGSRAWDVEGYYSTEISDNTSLRTGMSYSQRSALDGLPIEDEKRVDLYGIAGSQIQPRVLVEYGVYSTVRNGNLSLMPTGGMVIELGDDWQARTSISQRVDQADETYEGPSHQGLVRTSYVGDNDACRESGEACYEVMLAQKRDDGESVSVGAVHRQFAETLQVYFSDDVFDRLESVFMVRGDELPELQFSLVRRIAPRVLAKIESNVASGGGGIVYATDEQAYQNEVRYLVTSLDTRFQQTQTGLFVAFHHLEQALNPLADSTPAKSAANKVEGAPEVEMQRLQLMLTQDLNALADITSNLALRLNLEVSRGATPYALAVDDELYKKLTGGISISF